MAFLKPKTPPSIVDEAKKVRDKQKEARLREQSKKIAEVMKQAIWDLDIDVNDYATIMTASKALIDNWFNCSINSRKLNELVEEPEKEKDEEKAKETKLDTTPPPEER